MILARLLRSRDLGFSDDAIVKWQRTLRFTIPFGAAAFMIGWFLEQPSGQANPLDFIGYPVMALLLCVLHLILTWRARTLQGVVTLIVAGASSFFLLKLAYLLLGDHPPVLAQREMTETFYWIPVIYLLAYLIPGMRVGRAVTFAFTAGVLLLSLAYALTHLQGGQGEIPWGVIYALVQLNLADGVLMALTLTFLGLKEDYIRSQALNEALSQQACTDALTGLPNRFRLESVLTELLAECPPEHKVGLLFIDLDRFKVINDTLGHEAGDDVLVQVARRLKHSVRTGDLVARMSGDEFVVVLAELSDPQTVTLLAQRILSAMSMPFHAQGQRLNLSASIGASLFPDDADDIDALLRHADSAMYEVKRMGKNGFQRFEARTGLAFEKRRLLEKDLSKALAEGQFSLHYQPIVDLASGHVTTFEALIRWQHPEYGFISPAEFIPVAEESGFIVQLGSWVLDEAARQAKAWQRAGWGAYKVAVNVSPLQFLHAGFFDSVLSALSTHALAPEYLELELTESVVMHNLEEVEATLRRLRRLGITLAIDDFGTGYSSLAYLRDLPIDTLKIDRSFVRDLSLSREEPQFALALIQAILSLGQHLDLCITAEGIETEAQLELIRSLGCHAAQGYYLSRPLAPEALDEFMSGLEARLASPVTYASKYAN